MPTWYLYSLASVFALALSELAQKKALTTKDDISASTNNFIVWGIQGFYAFIFVIVLQIPVSVSLPILSWARLLLLAFIYFIASIFYYRSFKTESASLSATIASFSIVVSTTAGIIFFHESLTVTKVGGIVLVLIAIALVNYETNKTLQRAHLFALIGGFLYGLAYSLDKSFAIILNPHIYVIIICWACSVAGLILATKTIVRELPEITKTTLKAMFISAIGGFGFNTFTFLAYSVGGEVGKVDAINNTNIFLIIMVEILIFKDNAKLLRKVTAATMAFFGMYLLYLQL